MSKFKIAAAAAALAIVATAGTAGGAAVGGVPTTTPPTGMSFKQVYPKLKQEFGGGGLGSPSATSSIYGDPRSK
jgi:hypothetical protein